jgi:NAD(P)-dependent dehydrogenase (short-subunit alcohol dehydrogenase family)
MRNGQGGRWTEADVPAQRGRTAVITGANTGLGFETARVLAARGAQVVLATLRAAADPHARGGEEYGPGGRGELRGYPRLVASSERARDLDAQQRLWRESGRLTGVSYPV